MAKPSTEILFSLAARAAAASQPAISAEQPENPEQKNSVEMQGPPLEATSLALTHQKCYYIKETSHAPRLSLAEQLQLEETLIQNTALPLPSSKGLGQNK